MGAIPLLRAWLSATSPRPGRRLMVPAPCDGHVCIERQERAFRRHQKVRGQALTTA